MSTGRNVILMWPRPSSNIFARYTVLMILHTMDEIFDSICWNEALLSDDNLSPRLSSTCRSMVSHRFHSKSLREFCSTLYRHQCMKHCYWQCV